MAHPYASIREPEQRKAEEYCRGGGYARGGKIAEGVHQHERHDHPGKPLTDIKLRVGGSVKGDKPQPRPDKMARGGGVKGGKGPARVNIIISNGAGEADRLKQGLQAGTQVGAAMASKSMPMMPPRPPMAGPPPGLPPGMPPGGAPPMLPPGAAMAGPPPGLPPRPPMKRGGRLMVNDEGGGGGAEGRLEKAGMAGEVPVRAHVRRRAGGRV